MLGNYFSRRGRLAEWDLKHMAQVISRAHHRHLFHTIFQFFEDLDPGRTLAEVWAAFGRVVIICADVPRYLPLGVQELFIRLLVPFLS